MHSVQAKFVAMLYRPTVSIKCLLYSNQITLSVTLDYCSLVSQYNVALAFFFFKPAVG